jgi:DNA helicase HerA-like ATPase
VIKRAVTALELDGGDRFFGEPALNISDWFTVGTDGRGMINILDSESLINKPTLYSTFLLWMMSEMFETLPEVGDLDKPKMVFFFDEAHLLFNDAPKALLEKIEQVVKLIRSKGVGIFFITQNPRDIPNDVLAQLGNKIEHGLHAYTPLEQKAVRAAADSFRANPAFDTYETLMNLGTGEAVLSFLDEKGMPGISEKAAVLPPQSQMGSVADADRDRVIKGSLLYSRYAVTSDRDSAYEFLQRRGLEAQAQEQKQSAAEQSAKEQAAADKEKEKEEAAEAKEKEKAEKHAKTVEKRAAKSVASSVTGTIGREVGKQIGKNFGSLGKTVGGNLGASLGRGILATLFKL